MDRNRSTSYIVEEMILGLGVGRSHDEARVYPFWECDRSLVPTVIEMRAIELDMIRTYALYKSALLCNKENRLFQPFLMPLFGI